MTKRERKIKELKARGWSDARIKSYMTHWDSYETRNEKRKSK